MSTNNNTAETYLSYFNYLGQDITTEKAIEITKNYKKKTTRRAIDLHLRSSFSILLIVFLSSNLSKAPVTIEYVDQMTSYQPTVEESRKNDDINIK